MTADMHHNTSASTDLAPYNPRNKLLSVEDLTRVLETYGHDRPVRDVNIFRKAFTHRSYCTRKNENFVEGNADCPPDCLPLQEESSERLEFLGDAVLNLIVAEYLFRRYPDEHEGFLTRMRSKLVNGDMLRELCLVAGLDVHVLISRQIEDAGGRQAKNVLEDCFEAFIGALFVDSNKDGRGYADAASWVTNFLETNIDFSELVAKQSSYKDMLTKYFQYSYNCAPRYTVDETPCAGDHEPVVQDPAQAGEQPEDASAGGGGGGGGAHAVSQPRTTVFYTVCVKTRENVTVGTGSGHSKKAAENEAARRALVYFGQLHQ